MVPLNHERTTSSLAPPIFYVTKNWQLKDRRLPIKTSSTYEKLSCSLAKTTTAIYKLMEERYALPLEISQVPPWVHVYQVGLLLLLI